MQDYHETLTWIDQQQDWMVEKVIHLANINSGSLNLDGLAQVQNVLNELFAELDGNHQRHSLIPMAMIDENGQTQSQAVADALSWEKHAEAPLNVLMSGHMDTVYGTDHAFQQCRWLDIHTLNGPGVADLKGGLVIMLVALLALERSHLAGKIGWRVLLNPDEEIGSLSSAPLLAEYAGKAGLGLIFEPSLPDGTLAGARKGSGNFTVVATGKAAHAGREHHLGRNAIRALSEFTVALDELNGQVEGITINPGFFHGGGPVNIVPDKAVMKFNVRISDPAHAQWFKHEVNRILDIIDQKDGITLELHGNFGRMPKRLDDKTLELFELVRSSGKELGIEINWKDTGGCCDGNNLAAAGLANVDTLGAVGGAIHSIDEFIDVRSLTQRAKLTALLLMRIASGEARWNGRR